MVIIPISLQQQLEPGTLGHTIHQLVEQHIDMSVFEARYQNNSTGAKAIDPRVLLKVILLNIALPSSVFRLTIGSFGTTMDQQPYLTRC
jgi:hypothetical protein